MASVTITKALRNPYFFQKTSRDIHDCYYFKMLVVLLLRNSTLCYELTVMFYQDFSGKSY